MSSDELEFELAHSDNGFEVRETNAKVLFSQSHVIAANPSINTKEETYEVIPFDVQQFLDEVYEEACLEIEQQDEKEEALELLKMNDDLV